MFSDQLPLNVGHGLCRYQYLDNNVLEVSKMFSYHQHLEVADLQIGNSTAELVIASNMHS